MRFSQDTAEVFVPDGLATTEALGRTTNLCIAAHQDDIEIMAAGPILECFQRDDAWFTGVVMTDGRGSPRNGIYERYSDEEMRRVRFKEQRKAAVVGEYAAQILLDFPSKAIKDARNTASIDDLVAILRATRPQLVYTHNLADKHDTHVGVACKVIAAIRRLAPAERPQLIYGCEVWRDLDWMVDSDKISFDLSLQENLQAALVGVYDSQISGGKRYDLATLARRRANATYFESHGVDVTTGLSFAMDLTPLIADDSLEPGAYVQGFVQRFGQEVTERLRRIS